MEVLKPKLAAETLLQHLLSWLHRFFTLILVLCAVGMLLPFSRALPGEAGGIIPWLLDLGRHWQWLFLLVFVVSLMVLSLKEKRWLWAVLFIPLPWLSASLPVSGGDAASADLSVASANVHVSNSNPGLLLNWLAVEQPDVVVVQEVSPQYGAALEGLANYPYRVIAPERSAFGMALLSRYPLSNTRVFRDDPGIVRIETSVLLEDRMVKVMAIHPVPPVSPHFHRLRDELLKTLVMETGESTALIVGDLNATPWSSAFTPLEGFGWRRATGLWPTWPASGKGVLGIPIDHVLTSPGWRVSHYAVGPDLGSDHLPVIVRLVLP